MRREALVALFLVAGCGMPKTAPPPQPEAQPAAPALSPPAADLETTDEERSAEKPGPSGGSDAGAELDALDEEDATPAFEDEEEETVQLGGSDEEEEIQLTDSGVGVLELRRGSGSEAKPGTRITVHYVGRLANGMIFDSSRERGRPVTLELGAGRLIQGWEDGIPGMRVGGKRKLIVPPHLGYGNRRSGVIPPGSLLEFEVELLDVDE